MHFVAPDPFDEIVPRALPGDARVYTYLSGVAELACAALVAWPRTRRIGGFVSAALLLAVFPANVQMAIDWSDREPLERAIAYGRLPLQVPLIALAVSVASSASRRSRERPCSPSVDPRVT